MKQGFYAIFFGVVLFGGATDAIAEQNHNAPVETAGEHVRMGKKWMVSYQYGMMEMKGSRRGTSRITTSDVLADFMVAPTKMTAQMHMLGLMYMYNPKITFMGMLPYIQFSMDHINGASVKFNTKSSGIGDAQLKASYTVYNKPGQKFLLNGGVSFPTGSIDKRDATPADPDAKLPYPMQLGSGTFNLLPGVAYTGNAKDWAWGAQLNGVIHLGKNSNNYRLGDQYDLSVWGSYQLTDYLSLSTKLYGKTWGNISGADPDLNPLTAPTARTDLRGGERVDVLFGVDFDVPEKLFKGNKLSIEAGLPVYQRLDGPQLEMDFRVTARWTSMF